MNWDAIGAIAETLGAVGVIASLVYLATQIRHSREQMRENTRAVRASGYQTFFQNLDEVATRSSSSPEMAHAVRIGMADFDQLDEEGRYFFNNWIIGVLLAFENGHYQYRTGILEEDRWRILHPMIAAAVVSPGVRQWWRQNPLGNDFLGGDFVALVEEILGEQQTAETRDDSGTALT